MDRSEPWVAIVVCLLLAALGGFVVFVGWRQRAYPERASLALRRTTTCS